jgi:mannan endo-1,6-alpha-mannosidase
MVEIGCESTDSCNNSMWTMKGAFVQSLAQIAVAAPYTLSKILPLLQGSATAAAMTCTGGDTKDLCGGHWYFKKFDAHGSIDAQIAALGLFTSNLVAFDSKAPATQGTASNGTSTTGGNGTTTSSGGAGATKTGSNGANVLTGSAVGATVAIVAALLALF